MGIHVKVDWRLCRVISQFDVCFVLLTYAPVINSRENTREPFSMGKWHESRRGSLYMVFATMGRIGLLVVQLWNGHMTVILVHMPY